MSSEYLRSNPLAEHNSGIALSSKDLPPPQAGGTGNMYQGQGGRAFVQGGGGMSQYHSFANDGQDKSYANGSYSPVTVGYNSVTRGGRRRGSGSMRKLRRKTKTKRSKKCNCDIVSAVVILIPVPVPVLVNTNNKGAVDSQTQHTRLEVQIQELDETRLH